MCDPSIMGIASMATGMMDAFGQQDAWKKQDEEYDIWAKMQDKNRADENVNQEQFRLRAEAGRNRGVHQLSGGNQARHQVIEAGRLANDIASNVDLTRDFPGDDVSMSEGTDTLAGGAAADDLTTSVADKYLLAGQGDVAKNDPRFMADLAGKLSGAAKDARERIGHMATLGSYGGSSGGLDQLSTEALLRSGMTIEEINNLRNGSMSVYGVKQKVDPKHIVYQSGIRL